VSTTYISPALRQRVAERAGSCCEYCLIHESDTFLGCEVDHVISEKHGGETVLENLAFACVVCNRFKGSDIASLDPGGSLVRLYNPRTDRWAEHFALEPAGVIIEPRSVIGVVTERLLRLNSTDRQVEREALSATGRYPSSAALAIIAST
jgi:hypothetical protein